jgi:predicted RNA-binding protein with PUA-like domain
MVAMAYWLMKSEPDVYGIQHLQQEGTTLWDGIRNYALHAAW